MFYVALIVLLLCLLITLYFHHKYICNEIEELKELIKNIKLSDSNNSITKSLHSNNEPKKDTIKPIDELIESNEEINQSLKPNYSKFINVPIIEHKETNNINTDNIINNSSNESIKSIDKSLNNQSLNDQLQDNQELKDKVNNDANNDSISNKANNQVINESDKQLPSLIDSEDDLVIPEVIKNSFEYPSLNDLEQQVLNQITNEINNGISIINESLGLTEINKHPRVEEVSDEEPNNDNKDNKDEIINYEIKENIINDVLNDIKMQEVNNQNDIVKDEKEEVNNNIKDDINNDIKETKDNINDNVTNELLNENLKDPEVKESNESIKLKIDPEVINDLLNSNYKYLQLVKKCKDLGIDVAKKKKEEIFKILKSYL